MYSSCLFCNRELGANAVLEAFPVGRRLAFDAAKGRLWVVCRKCERWNLSPIEERWEAIEAAERLFRDTRMRVSTENIGLARHAEGLELVRVGSPQRPEFAAWRYGDQFGRRRRRALLIGGAAVAVVGTIAVAGIATGIISGGIAGQSGSFVNIWQNGRVIVRVPTCDGGILKLKAADLRKADLHHADGVLTLRILHRKKERIFTGTEAERVAGLILPRLNSAGARASVVQQAVQQLEAVGGPDAFLSRVDTQAVPRRRWNWDGAPNMGLGRLPTPARLALEMALHEEQERRALEGELKGLELAWQEAEEIAGIADDLLLPEAVRVRLRDARGE